MFKSTINPKRNIVMKCIPKNYIMIQKIARVKEHDKLLRCLDIKEELIKKYGYKDIIYSIPCDSPLLNDINEINNLFNNNNLTTYNKKCIRNQIGYYMVFYENDDNVLKFLESLLEYYDCI